jgi:hypothetical protein
MKVTGCCASCAVGPVSGHLATCQMMLASAQGMPAPRVAEVTFTNPDRVRDVIHTLNTPTRGA